MENSKVFSMSVAKVYPLLVAKGKAMNKILRGVPDNRGKSTVFKKNGAFFLEKWYYFTVDERSVRIWSHIKQKKCR